MSKNTGATLFRSFNVDDYDEDKYQDEHNEDQKEQGPNYSEVVNFLNAGKNADALIHILNNPPADTKVSRDKTSQLTTKVLTSFRGNDMDTAVEGLNSKQIDMLMKYIYIGFEFFSEGSSAILLTWHEKVFAIGGLGSIIRVLTDRSRV
ncbi:actin-related protein 2/3 complex subunit 5-C [Octopus bimaculoides]|uniref:Actin-related protein 2/3 complex subunit 5 n=1 Tax=Octopus bimaculoides TaxID=37653 RepID=A0A0L8GBJ7_OCTBM|nr:actin-related protein 2/3 complex subunit 5-C [Octopus bimaculoides]|eukprot:XP_014782800.1 PREDICTED: actin-related protein 2/3 complex subunit 5-like [Octopus bimaculoides]